MKILQTEHGIFTDNELTKQTAEEVYQEWLKRIDISVVKEEKVSNSKELLASWLVNNPLFSTIHTAEGEYYTVTEDKQSQLTQMITLFNLAIQTGTEFKLTWNSTGGVCEEWTIEELTTLAFQITEYVLPRVKKQQAYEVAITACDTLEEVEAIEINYEAV